MEGANSGVASFLEKIRKTDPKKLVFEFCTLAEIVNDKHINSLLNTQWLFFATQFEETELLIDIIERDFNRPGTYTLSV